MISLVTPEWNYWYYLFMTDKRYTANEVRLQMGFLAYNLLHLIRRFYVRSEKARRPIEWIIMRLVKVGEKLLITPGIGMSISHRLLYCITITGLYSI